MSLSPQFLDELRSRTTLSTLLGKSIKVQKAGREYKACCPFHNEKTPSFTINDEKGFYHCFGCGAHGDAIRWMTDQRGLPFMEAVKELADAAGMDVPAADPRAAKRAEDAKSLHDVMSAAQDWFVAQLNGLEGAEARDYLSKRGITDQTCRAFGLGFAPDSRGKLKEALKAFPEPMLIESGMLIQPEDEPGKRARESYDRFRGRLMIPIRDQRGRVIAFGGRILGAGEPKYLNSPETPLFDKGRTLYNLDKAAPAARKANRVIVVEGYMDAIMIAQAGLAEAVAPLGTALTEHQIEKLWTMVETPTLCFDGDSAGQRAALRAAHRSLPMLTPGYSLAFAALPTSQDPDDFIRSSGLAAFEDILKNALPMADMLWRTEEAASPLYTPEARAGLKQRLLQISEKITEKSIRSQYLSTLNGHFYEKYGWRKSDKDKIVKLSSQTTIDAVERNIIERVSISLNRSILFGLTRWPQVLYSHREQIFRLKMPTMYLKRWRDLLIDIAEQNPNIEEDMVKSLLDDSDLDPKVKFDLLNDLKFGFLTIDVDPTYAMEMLTSCIDAMFDEQRTDEQLEIFSSVHFSGVAQAEFSERDWHSLRALQTAKQSAHARLERFTEIVEQRLMAA